MNRAPPPARFSAHTRPPCASTRPFTIARPSPRPLGLGRPSEHPVEGLEQVGQCRGGNARAAIGHGDGDAARRLAHLDRDLGVGLTVLGGIFDQVVDHLTDLDRVEPHRRQVVRNVDVQPVAARSPAVSRSTTSSSSMPRSCQLFSGRSLPPSMRDRSSRLPTRRLSRSASSSIAWAKPCRSSSVQATSCWRRLPAEAMIVASGVRRSCDTAFSSDAAQLRPCGAESRPRSPPRGAARARSAANLRRRGGHEAIVGGVEGLRRADQQQRADATLVDPHRYQVDVAVTGIGSGRMHHAHPAARASRDRRARPRAGVQNARGGDAVAESGQGGRISRQVSGSSHHSVARARRPARADSELGAQALGHGGQDLVELALAEQPKDVVQDDRLALALVRLTGPVALAGGELAGDRRGQQKEQQRNPLARIGHGQLVDGLDEEPVEDQEGTASRRTRPRRGRRRPPSPGRRSDRAWRCWRC